MSGSEPVKVTLQRRARPNLSSNLGRALMDDLIVCIEELVINEHDAGAHDIEVILDESRVSPGDRKGFLSISGDGTGMLPDSTFGHGPNLEDFFSMGGSEKVGNPYTDEGRRRVGKFGIATVGLLRLARHYTLDTWCAGLHSQVEEDLSHGTDDTRSFEGTARDSIDGMLRGTKIVIDDLAYLREGLHIDTEELYHRLSLDIPAHPDLELTLNGRIVEPMVKVQGTRYVVDFKAGRAGRIYGDIWVAEEPIAKAGVYVKVNGRAVGGGKPTLSDEGIGLGNRVFGVIHADGLDQIVTFDWGGFVRDDPRYKAVVDGIKEVLQQTRRDSEMEARLVRRRTARKVLGQIGEQIGQTLSASYGGETPFTIIYDPEQAGRISRLSKDERRLYVNHAAQELRMAQNDAPGVKAALATALEHAVVSDLLSDDGARATYAAVVSQAAELRRKPRGDTVPLTSVVEASQLDIVRISPDRVYSRREVGIAIGESVNSDVLARLFEAGVLLPYKDTEGDFLGRDVAAAAEAVRGRLFLAEAIQKIDSEQRDPRSYGRQAGELTRHLAAMVQGIPNYVHNIGSRTNPLFVVDQTRVHSFGYFAEHKVFPADILIQGRFNLLADLDTGFGSLVYLLKVRQSDFSREMAREEHRAQFSFLDERGVLPPDAKRFSVYAPIEGAPHVGGYIVGTVKPLAELFVAHGFKRVMTKNDHLKSVTNQVSKQDAAFLPMSEAKEFRHPLGPVIMDLYER
ncbi:hypothetical protein HYT52_04780 [Candidatus Woesearchaeota archaeon]|nr:hypothetical protein [Candidatus Woesearchaeota archaeon]